MLGRSGPVMAGKARQVQAMQGGARVAGRGRRGGVRLVSAWWRGEAGRQGGARQGGAGLGRDWQAWKIIYHAARLKGYP